jgi:predicted subunit of tRNA(5-methylaminomethyl-2-thiouridylate) methyltransferase
MKALVLYSGGLDSRLVVKILQDKGYDVEALHFNLPFGCGCCNFNCNFKFTQMNEAKLTIFDCCKGKLLKEYLKILKKPQYGMGAGVNPCIDCKIFMFKKAKEYADKKGIKVIATGEVVGQRPMSQTASAMRKIDGALGFEIKRPLIELGFKGRRRLDQMKLAEKYKIKYPSPGGGCLLCEKQIVNKFKILFKNNLIDEKTLPLSLMGRHFFIDDVWFVVARDEKECIIIENSKNVIKGKKGMPAVYFNKLKGKKKALELQEAYGKRDASKFMEYKI